MTALILALSSAGALLLIAGEFTRLYATHIVVTGALVKSYGTGPHHDYALALIGGACLLLALGVGRAGSRPALLAIGVLAVVSLLISLLGDLPDAHGSGLLILRNGRFTTIVGRPAAGLYMQTLGAMLMLIASVGGFVLAGPPPALRRRPPAAPPERASAEPS